MNRLQAEKHITEITAFANGENIQYRGHDGVWLDADDPHWHIELTYRVTPPEPTRYYIVQGRNGSTYLNAFATMAGAENDKRLMGTGLEEVDDYYYEIITAEVVV